MVVSYSFVEEYVGSIMGRYCVMWLLWFSYVMLSGIVCDSLIYRGIVCTLACVVWFAVVQ